MSSCAIRTPVRTHRYFERAQAIVFATISALVGLASLAMGAMFSYEFVAIGYHGPGFILGPVHLGAGIWMVYNIIDEWPMWWPQSS